MPAKKEAEDKQIPANTDTKKTSSRFQKARDKSKDKEEKQEQQPEKKKSTSGLHPEKLTYAKFSERKKSLDEDNISIWRLLLYLVIVIVVGAGLVLGIQEYIKYQNSTSQPDTNQTTDVDESSISVSTLTRGDATADPEILPGDQFIEEPTFVQGQVLDTETSAFSGLSYERYETVERLAFMFRGLEQAPEATIDYDQGDETLYIEWANITATDDELKPGSEMVKLSEDTTVVSSVQNTSVDTTKLRISVYLSEPVQYVARYDGENLYLDMRQSDFVAEPEVTENETPTGNSDLEGIEVVLADPDRPDEPFTDNSYSKKTQYIASAYRGTDLRIWNYNYRDYGDRYEFKFRIKHKDGSLTTEKPNVKAYLNNDQSDPKLVLEIYNVSWEILHNYADSECFDGVGYGNVEKICGEFDEANNMVTYEISLVKLADFEVDAVDNTSYDASRPGDVVWVKIKDN